MPKGRNMKLGLVVYSSDPETVWNAFRLGIFSLKNKLIVRIWPLSQLL